MNFLLGLLSLFFVVVFIASVALQLMTWRRSKAVRPIWIAISQVAAFVSMAAFSAITARPPGFGWWVLLLALGLAGGVVYGGFVKVSKSESGVVMNYTLPWIVIWASLMVVTQLNAIISKSVPVFIYSLAILNLGINMGMNGRVLSAYRGVTGAWRISAMGIATAIALAGVLGYSVSAPAPANASLSGTTIYIYEGPGDLPEQIRGAYVLGGGQPVLGSHDSYGWAEFFPDAGDAQQGPMVNLSYGITLNGDYVSVDVEWFGEQADADARYSDYSAGFDAQGPLGPGVLLDGPSAHGVLARNGNAVITWETNAYYEDPSQMPGLEHASAVVSAVQPIDVYQFFEEDSAPPIAGTPGGSSSGESGGDPGAGVEGGSGSTSGPLHPAQSLAAIALSSLILATGSGVQALASGLRPIEALDELRNRTRGITDRFGANRTSADGRVLYRPPWDEGGPTWMSAEDVRGIEDMKSRGFHWSKQWGWVTTAEDTAYTARDQRLWADHQRQDPEIVRLQDAIRENRRAAQEARDAARKLEYQIRLQERVTSWEEHSQSYSTVINQLEWLGRGASAIQMISDGAVAGLSWFVGPFGHPIRVGYNMAKGQATALGECIEEGRGFRIADQKRGLVNGAKNLAWDYGTEGAFRLGAAGVRMIPGAKEAGQAIASGAGRIVRSVGDSVRPATDQARRLVEIIRGPSSAGAGAAVPGELAGVRAVLHEAVGHVDDIAAREGMGAAVASVDEARILALFRNSGMKQLGELEAAGVITKDQARVLTTVLSRRVDAAVAEGTKDAVELFHMGNPMVRIKEVLVGDAGSSARGAARSVLTDFDRTMVPVFDAEDVARYAFNRGITRSQAAAELGEQFARIQEGAMATRMRPAGLTLDDIDYKAYNGFGAGSGPADAYPVDHALTSQFTQGGGIVVREGGSVTRVGGAAVVDQWKLEQVRAGARGVTREGAGAVAYTAEGRTIMNLADPKIPIASYPGIAQQQLQSMAKAGDIKTTAKALERIALMAERVGKRGGPSIDPRLAEIARQIRRNPQWRSDAQLSAQIWRNTGLSEASFIKLAQGEAARFTDDIARFANSAGR